MAAPQERAILVTGGAGYVGSVAVDLLRAAGNAVVVLDDLERGHREAVDADVPLYVGRVGDAALVDRICREHRIDACIHFAARAYVGESVTAPRRYFEDNVADSVALVGALLDAGVRLLVFSSTCATYGEPVALPIDEQHPQAPTNPYGWSKLAIEQMLRSYDRAYGLRFAALRYFNAAGATAKRGERHDPETHLIPLALAAAAGTGPPLSVFGDDYPTPDGTAIRDYVHVEDLGRAHIAALDHLRAGRPSALVNLGTGRGTSVLEVVEAVRKVTGRAVPVEMRPRRPGDPARLVANADHARALFGWTAQYTAIEAIVETAWRWRR